MSCKLQGQLKCLNTYDRYKKYDNYEMLRNKYVYTIFKPKRGSNIRHVNITMIKDFEHIEDSLSCLKDMLYSGDISRVTVDNTTASFNVNTFLDLSQLYQSLRSDWNVSFSAQLFPAVCWRLNMATVQIFSSGKIVIIGAKSERDIKEVVAQCYAIMKKY